MYVCCQRSKRRAPPACKAGGDGLKMTHNGLEQVQHRVVHGRCLAEKAAIARAPCSIQRVLVGHDRCSSISGHRIDRWEVSRCHPRPIIRFSPRRARRLHLTASRRCPAPAFCHLCCGRPCRRSRIARVAPRGLGANPLADRMPARCAAMSLSHNELRGLAAISAL